MMATRLESPHRRRTDRGAPPNDPSREMLAAWIVGAYREMPGLILHADQAARLFGVSDETCRIVLTDLVQVGKLRRASDGQYLLP